MDRARACAGACILAATIRLNFASIGRSTVHVRQRRIGCRIGCMAVQVRHGHIAPDGRNVLVGRKPIGRGRINTTVSSGSRGLIHRRIHAPGPSRTAHASPGASRADVRARQRRVVLKRACVLVRRVATATAAAPSEGEYCGRASQDESQDPRSLSEPKLQHTAAPADSSVRGVA